jgi:hypothetical protein
MNAGGEEFPQLRRGVRDGVGPRDAERVEAVRACRFGQRGFDGGGCQKSRLA